MPDVRLVDLEVIRRYSLAVRQEAADAAELLDVLDADRRRLERLVKGGRTAATRRGSTARRTATASRTTGKSRKGSR